MGSTTSGKFPDYPRSGQKKDEPEGSGGRRGTDKCARDLLNISLEEVGRSTFFRAHSTVPVAGTAVSLRSTLVGPRLSIDTQDGQDIGFLPTEYNYLLVCLKRGFTYSGEVTSSSQLRVPSVRINLRYSAP